MEYYLQKLVENLAYFDTQYAPYWNGSCPRYYMLQPLLAKQFCNVIMDTYGLFTTLEMKVVLSLFVTKYVHLHKCLIYCATFWTKYRGLHKFDLDKCILSVPFSARYIQFLKTTQDLDQMHHNM
jgi:hypothetical protein